MNRTCAAKTASRISAALIVLLLGSTFTKVAHAAISFYQTGASGGGIQNFYAPTNAVSGTMTAPVPRFNGGLGTLLQADFEFAASATGTWLSTIPSKVGTSTLSLSGPADAGGQSMGLLSVGFVDTYDDVIGSNSFDSQFANLTLTSGAFFNTLTGVGTFNMNWIFSGNTTLDTLAIGTGPGNEGFSWGGSVHVLYTYEAVPEPGTLVMAALGMLGIFGGWARKHTR